MKNNNHNKKQDKDIERLDKLLRDTCMRIVGVETKQEYMSNEINEIKKNHLPHILDEVKEVRKEALEGRAKIEAKMWGLIVGVLLSFIAAIINLILK